MERTEGPCMTKADFRIEHLGADYLQDPYSVHARLRAQCPISAVIMPGGTPAWLVTGYSESRMALADPRLRKNPPGFHSSEDFSVAALEAHMLNSDPPDHERLRQLVNRAFTTRRVERLRRQITAVTAGLLDEMSAQRSVDLLTSFAFPLTVEVICELLGVPACDRENFLAWSSTIASGTAAAEDLETSAAMMISYFMALLSAKRREPADDLLSALVAAQIGDDSLSESELVSMAFLLLVAGHETTVNLIGNGMLALLLNPSELNRIRTDPLLLHSAVEELLRYGNPVNSATFRFADESLEISGARISRGEIVVVALSSANRDPSRYPEPDRLDVGRDSSGHLAFGHGIHYCLGAPLARLEAEIAFWELVSRFGSIRLAVPPGSLRWRSNALIHGLEALPVRLVP